METQQTISQWGRETFGQHPALTIATRMNIEVAELLHDLGNGFDPLLTELLEANIRIAEAVSARANELHAQGMPFPATVDKVRECPDVAIILLQVAEQGGLDLQPAIDQKMVVNRNRTWGRTESGRFQHIQG